MASDRPHLFVFGLGFSGQELARRKLSQGWRVSGTTRKPEKQAALEAAGITAHLFDRDRPLDDPGVLAEATHILASAPPDSLGDPVLDHHGADIADTTRWIGYLSTTGVYGDTGGAEVAEASPVNPNAERSKRRVAAEDGWLALWQSRGLPVHIFRLAGIYGPGRSTVETVRAGKARRIDKPGHKFSRIHVDDIAGILEASIDKPRPGGIYNCCDDEPEGPAEVTRYVCDLLGVEPPALIPFEEAKKTMSPMGLSFWNDNRRVSNSLLSQELGYSLRYPTYREGLRALADGQDSTGGNQVKDE